MTQESVDSLCIGQHDGAQFVFGIAPISLRLPGEAQGTHGAVSIQGHASHHLTQSPGGDAAVQFHLPQPILSVNEALREEKVVSIACVDVWDAPPVTNDFYSPSEPRQV
jgi:hypothetical protein